MADGVFCPRSKVPTSCSAASGGDSPSFWALLSDCGTNLLSHLMLDVCRLLGVKPWKLSITAYHPQSDGMVERFNHTIKSMIWKHVAVLGAQWDQYLSGLPGHTGILPMTLQVRNPLSYYLAWTVATPLYILSYEYW